MSLLLPALIPTDVWTETVLQFLDVCDLMLTADVAAPLSAGAQFVAARVLGQDELDWFAAQAIPVALLVECDTSLPHAKFKWKMNGQLHRDGDLPAVEFDDGRREWYCHGKLHRDGDQPAVEGIDGDRHWYFHGKLHRDGDMPAIKRTKDSRSYVLREWYHHGERHRGGDQPAVEGIDGDRYWYFHGKQHRDGGLPAVEHADRRVWYVHGELHRDGGLPAVERDGARLWYINGKCIRWEYGGTHTT